MEKLKALLLSIRLRNEAAKVHEFYGNLNVHILGVMEAF